MRSTALLTLAVLAAAVMVVPATADGWLWQFYHSSTQCGGKPHTTRHRKIGECYNDAVNSASVKYPSCNATYALRQEYGMKDCQGEPSTFHDTVGCDTDAGVYMACAAKPFPPKGN